MSRAHTLGATLVVMVAIVFFGNCGELDPAEAIYGAEITVDPQSVDYAATCEAGTLVQIEDQFFIRALVVATQATGGGSEGSQMLPMNDVEVRWTPRFPVPGVELYLPEDNVNDVDPLEVPYVDRTNDRGLCEIKVNVNFQTVCGSQYSGDIIADIGVASELTTLLYATEEQAGDDDDDE